MTEHVNQNKLTVDIEDWECDYCTSTTTQRLSREDGEWVHYICGMPVDDDVAERADDLLARGQGEHKYPEAEVEQISDSLTSALEKAEATDETEAADSADGDVNE